MIGLDNSIERIFKLKIQHRLRMAENKRSFLLYADMIYTVEKMPKNKQGDLLMTILRYVNDQNLEVEDLVVSLVWEPIKQQLKRDLRKWDHSLKDKKTNGQLGNLKRWHLDLYNKVMDEEMSLEEALAESINRKSSLPYRKTSHSDSEGSLPIANVAVNDNVTVNVTDTVTVKNIKRANALVVSNETTVADLKNEYKKLVESLTGKELKEVYLSIKKFIEDNRPSFAEPYVDVWNIVAKTYNLEEVKMITDDRRDKIRTRSQENSFDFMKALLSIKQNSFYRGDNSNGWKVTFNYIIRSQKTYTEMIEKVKEN